MSQMFNECEIANENHPNSSLPIGLTFELVLIWDSFEASCDFERYPLLWVI